MAEEWGPAAAPCKVFPDQLPNTGCAPVRAHTARSSPSKSEGSCFLSGLYFPFFFFFSPTKRGSVMISWAWAPPYVGEEPPVPPTGASAVLRQEGPAPLEEREPRPDRSGSAPVPLRVPRAPLFPVPGLISGFRGCRRGSGAAPTPRDLQSIATSGGTQRTGHTGRGADSGKIKDPPTLRAPSLTLLCTCSAPPRCGSPAPATRAGCWRTAPPWTR